MSGRYLVCDQCDAELNPNKWDDCEKYYNVNGEIYCKDCFKDYVLERVEIDLDAMAEFLGIEVVNV